MSPLDAEPLSGWVALPSLPDGLSVLDWRVIAGDVIVISTADGVTPASPFVLFAGAEEWTKLVVH